MGKIMNVALKCLRLRKPHERCEYMPWDFVVGAQLAWNAFCSPGGPLPCLYCFASG